MGLEGVVSKRSDMPPRSERLPALEPKRAGSDAHFRIAAARRSGARGKSFVSD
jgi:hypothetical protein